METKSVFIGIPTHNDTVSTGTLRTTHSHGHSPVTIATGTVSLLALGFNRLLCEAVNGGFDYFCLLHADVSAEQDWLKKMLELSEIHNLDVLSVVLPVKSMQADITSTALDSPTHQHNMSLAECRELPPTFTGRHTKDVFGNDKLLVNTGLILIRLSAIKPLKHYFEIKDHIVEQNGRYVPVNSPEDWNFSRMLYKAKVRYGATREIEAGHSGTFTWSNQTVWGKK